jgi:hypothetical protein
LSVTPVSPVSALGGPPAHHRRPLPAGASPVGRGQTPPRPPPPCGTPISPPAPLNHPTRHCTYHVGVKKNPPPPLPLPSSPSPFSPLRAHHASTFPLPSASYPPQRSERRRGHWKMAATATSFSPHGEPPPPAIDAAIIDPHLTPRPPPHRNRRPQLNHR